MKAAFKRRMFSLCQFYYIITTICQYNIKEYMFIFRFLKLSHTNSNDFIHYLKNDYMVIYKIVHAYHTEIDLFDFLSSMKDKQ